MFLVALFGGLTIFCAAQALFWSARRRAEERAASLLQKLGGQIEVKNISLFKEAEDDYRSMSSIRRLMVEAGEAPDLKSFLTKMMMWALICGVGFMILSGSLLPFIWGALLGSSIPYFGLKRARASRMADIEKSVPEALEVMIISLKAGHALPKAVSTTAAEISGPFSDELNQLSEELRLGRSVEDVFLRLGNRLSGVKTVRTLCVSVLVLQQTGGNLVEVLEQLIEALHEQAQYVRKLAAMTAEGRMSARILGGLPPMFMLAVYLVGPDYIGKLFTPGAGYLVLGVALVLYFGGIFWLNSMISTKG